MLINWKHILVSVLCSVMPVMTGFAAELQSRDSIEHAAYMYVFEQVQLSYDNAQILNYSGSIVSQHEMSCYQIE